ncbi:anthranilate synthase component I [Humisphaera borealis]|uniref:Anthranilate synthase component 1 n=1 Tax=Humisphaera borealis TaxID=2807512 RepID=A0A7M2X4B0_9BACT|nr:anthranilate synthase component I [Humisphaera borealis]QOV91600.1 anthranilate synthase component I [Humisphaera borealis]
MRRYFPDLDGFRAAAASADIVPVYRQLLADRLTPVSAFEVLGRDDHAFLLESVVGGEKIGRYSFIATAPAWVYEVSNGIAKVSRPGTHRLQSAADPLTRTFQTTDPLADLHKLMPTGRFHRSHKLPSFTGGLVGYAGYDTIRYYEGEKLPAPPRDDRKVPDILFGLYGELVIFDSVDKTIKVVANAFVDGKQNAVSGTQKKGDAASIEAAYADACRRVDDLVTRLQQPTSLKLGEIDPTAPSTLKFASNMTRDEYEAAVSAGKEYIRAGDIFQFVPSQRLRVESSVAPLDVYRALRIINPSPFMFYLKSPACTLIGSSPEILCRVENGVATTRPLAGTRKRGANPTEDKLLEAELLADPKERAEHIMLVDLHRNDIGRVCKIGSVKVDDVMTVERYSHVMHITTNVTGQLEDGMTSFDALRVSLPVGTVSGAPKIRAMQIIDEMEPTRRGPYAGAVGYVDLAGDMDTCIALRTIVWQQGKYDVQVGAGVVADSVPASEYEETINKAKAMLKAVEIAQEGF